MSDESLFIKDDIDLLRKKILEADKAYYVDSNPILPDLEYDRLFNRLLELEQKYPEFNDLNSPTKRIGSDINNTLPESEHSVPILSFCLHQYIPNQKSFLSIYHRHYPVVTKFYIQLLR